MHIKMYVSIYVCINNVHMLNARTKAAVLF